MRHIEQTSKEALKERMRRRLDDIGWEMTDLVAGTRDTYRNVQRWLREETAPPSEFVARYASAVPVNPKWLLTGEGSPDPVSEETRAAAFDRIAEIVDGVRAPVRKIRPEDLDRENGDEPGRKAS